MSKNEGPHVRLQEKLRQRKSEYRYRTLKPADKTESSRFVRMGDVDYLNFSSNDYLNLSSHLHLKKKSLEFTKYYGTGSSSSRLITGTLNIHINLEERLAGLYQKESALLFSTGFQANSTILPAITEKQDVIIADKYCHNSILTGCLAAKADFYRFRHNDLDHLEAFLKKKKPKGIGDTWIVTESLFSMDGDRAPLEEIIKLSARYGAKLYVDDAHAFGVYGDKGLGYGADFPEIDLLVSTFGKAGGSFGAFAASAKIVTDALKNFCSGFIYTTALPPSVVGSIDAALDLIPEMNSERQYLCELSEFLHHGLVESGLHTAAEPSHILPVLFADEEQVLKTSRLLQEKGMVVTAIRPPTVPENMCRFRISLTTAHQKSDCKKLLTALEV